MTNDELIKAREEAWIESYDFSCREFYSRFYKKKGKWINPFNSMDELNSVKNHRRELYDRWLELHFECHKRRIPDMPLSVYLLWIEENTPDGRRYRRTR